MRSKKAILDTNHLISILISKCFDFNDEFLIDGKVILILSDSQNKAQRHKKQDSNPHTSSA
ncbi:MAG: hypothetical protein Q8O72_14935 [Bacteroidales bacterium]|nr:hypothetical protein [Bacteroidales bacterium]